MTEFVGVEGIFVGEAGTAVSVFVTDGVISATAVLV